ncbi:MAG: hypothetical protein IID07_08670 [Gemmatimonadetes bacterium]|nr:hypothetical protein [Gemmatimonadota bacterium]
MSSCPDFLDRRLFFSDEPKRLPQPTDGFETGTRHTPIFRVMMVVGGGVKKGLDIQLDMVASTLETEAHQP